MQRPAGYPNTDSKEVKGVIIFHNILNIDKVKADINYRDKVPNYDGYLELVDGQRVTYGKLEVPVKSISKEVEMPIIFSCPISLFSYSETTNNPLLLICVNLTDETAYWIHINKDIIKGIKEDQQWINLDLSNNIIDNSESYLDSWNGIVKEYQTKIRLFDEVNESYKRLSKYTNPSIGLISDEVEEIHAFLDMLNGFYDGYFNVIKRIYYRDSWKLGLAYHVYKENEVIYDIYPIHKRQNDVQIKIFNDISEYRKDNRLSGHHIEDPIKTRPYNYSLEIIESMLDNIFENRLLNHYSTDYIASEYVYYILDRHYYDAFEYGTEQTIEEIREYVRGHINDVFRREVAPAEYPELGYVIGSDPRALTALMHSLYRLEMNGHSTLKRPLLPREYGKRKGGYIWSWYSPEILRKNLMMFYENYYEAYHTILSNNFPQLYDLVDNYRIRSKIIIGYTCKDEYKSHEDIPKFNVSYLTNDENEYSFEIHNMEEFEHMDVFDFNNYKTEIEYGGQKYIVDAMSHGVLDFIFRDTPMLDVAYDSIEKTIRHYIQTIQEPQ